MMNCVKNTKRVDLRWAQMTLTSAAVLMTLALWTSNPEVARAKEADAKSVAAAVQSFYDQTTTVSAEFQQSYFFKLYQRYEKSKGKVVFQRPGKMRWDYEAPHGKVIVSDAKTLTVYEPGEKGQKGQAFKQNVSDAKLPAAMGFLLGKGDLNKDFDVRLIHSDKLKYDGHVLELRPKKTSPHYKRIVFFVSASDKSQGVVQRVLVLDHEGNRNKFDFSNLRFNKKLGSTTFSWKPPAGTRIVKP